MTKNKSITVDRNIRKVGENFKANVTINGRQRYVGTYPTLKEAQDARDSAEAKIVRKPNNMVVASNERLKRYKEELIGKKFGKLTIQDVYRERKAGNVQYRLICKCDCGNTTTPYLRSVVGKNAETVSCGCYQGESGKKVLDSYLYSGTRVTNLKAKARNKLGVKGVRLTKSGTYEASIYFKGQSKYLGTYKTLDEAAAAREEAEKELFDPVIDEFNKQAKYKVERNDKK